MRLPKATRAALEREVVPSGARLELTRIIRSRCSIPDGDDDGGIALLRENEFINIANQVMGKPIYVLEGGQWGEYHPAEHAWHHGQRELIMRVPDTAELAEILADYLQRGMMLMPTVNQILRSYNCGFTYEDLSNGDEVKVGISVTSEDAIPEPDLSQEHPNVRKLVHRMETALSDNDYTAVLHAAASVFETLAKDLINNPKVNDQTLGGIFGAFRGASNLPTAVLDYIHQIYKDRNSTPLAGHGSLAQPNLDKATAVVLVEFTKFAVRTERSLRDQKIVLKKAEAPAAASQKTSSAASSPVEATPVPKTQSKTESANKPAKSSARPSKKAQAAK